MDFTKEKVQIELEMQQLRQQLADVEKMKAQLLGDFIKKEGMLELLERLGKQEDELPSIGEEQ